MDFIEALVNKTPKFEFAWNILVKKKNTKLSLLKGEKWRSNRFQQSAARLVHLGQPRIACYLKKRRGEEETKILSFIYVRFSLKAARYDFSVRRKNREDRGRKKGERKGERKEKEGEEKT